jgi:hypothetical protein
MVGAVAAVASTAAAFASLWIAYYLNRRSEASAEIDRTRAEAQAEAERRHATFNTTAEWRRDLRDWASEAIDVLSEASYLCDESEQPEAAFSCRHRLSALIDRGRFFLPNLLREEHGADKPFAYRGLRHAGLDPLVAAERVLSTGTTGAFKDQKHAIIGMKREFVSSIQQILDPDGANEELEAIISRANSAVEKDRRAGALLRGHQELPPGADELLSYPRSQHFGLCSEHT